MLKVAVRLKTARGENAKFIVENGCRRENKRIQTSKVVDDLENSNQIEVRELLRKLQVK